MAAGLTTIAIKDAAGTSRNMQFWSSDGAATGDLSPVMARAFEVTAGALTRPANMTPYAVNDSVSNNATAASVTALSTGDLAFANDYPVELTDILLTSTDTGPGTASAIFRLHLFNSDPTASSGVVGGDNAAWSNKQAGWIGAYSGIMRPFSDGSRGILLPEEGILRSLKPVLGAKNFYWQLQTLTIFTSSANSTTFTPTFKGLQSIVLL